jgi:uncharacterized protein (DUF885 family)
MTYRRLVVALALCLHAGCKPPEPPTPPPVQQEPPPPTATQAAEDIIADYFAAWPVTATAVGEHRFDTAWPNLTPDGIAADRTRIDNARALLDEVERGTLTADDKVDVAILRNQLALQAFEHEVEQPWARDPHWYASQIGTGLDDLASRDFAPIDQRAAALAARMSTLPTLVEQAIANLDPAATMIPHTEVAITQLEGIVELIRATIPQRMATAPEDARAQIGVASGPAIAAIRALQAHLRKEILPKAAGEWRLGAENYERKLALTLDTTMTADDLRRLAVVEHGRVRSEMAKLADELAPVLFPPRTVRKLRNMAAREEMLVAAVLGELSAAHTQATTLRDAIAGTLARLSAFVDEKDIVTLDPNEVLEVIWTPPHQRGVAIAGLASPGPLDVKPGLPSFYLVQPIPPGWEPRTTESFLREYNDFMLEILSIHEAIPGHFVQGYYAKREPSKVRRVFASGTFVEGWAVYTELVMVQAGYSGAGPAPDAKRPPGISKGLWKVMTSPELRAKAIALHGLKFYLRSVTNAILDHSVHAGAMTREEAIDLMVSKSFQQEGEAIQKWTRAQLSSCQLSTYFVGSRQWWALRQQAEARPGFTLAGFHDAAIGHGAPPVDRLPELMGWDGAAPPVEGEPPAPAPEGTEPAPAEPAPSPDAAAEDLLGPTKTAPPATEEEEEVIEIEG